MVRRRSTVRFRKGALRSWSSFEHRTGYIGGCRVPLEWHTECCYSCWGRRSEPPDLGYGTMERFPGAEALPCQQSARRWALFLLFGIVPGRLASARPPRSISGSGCGPDRGLRRRRRRGRQLFPGTFASGVAGVQLAAGIGTAGQALTASHAVAATRTASVTLTDGRWLPGISERSGSTWSPGANSVAFLAVRDRAQGVRRTRTARSVLSRAEAVSMTKRTGTDDMCRQHASAGRGRYVPSACLGWARPRAITRWSIESAEVAELRSISGLYERVLARPLEEQSALVPLD